MCGISGMITKKPSITNKNIFLCALMINESRGKHSTGVFGYNLDKESSQLIRRTKPASEFVKNWANTIRKDSNVFIGHTRFATHGSISKKNTHPFKYGPITYVHNGVVSNYKDMAKKIGINVPNVDSQIFGKIFKNNFQHLEDINGTANVFSFNEEDNLVTILRHDNPLFAYRDKKQETLLFSSVFLLPKDLAILEDWQEVLIPNDHLVTIDTETLEMITEKVEFTYYPVRQRYIKPTNSYTPSNFSSNRYHNNNRYSSTRDSYYNNDDYSDDLPTLDIRDKSLEREFRRITIPHSSGLQGSLSEAIAGITLRQRLSYSTKNATYNSGNSTVSESTYEILRKRAEQVGPNQPPK